MTSRSLVACQLLFSIFFPNFFFKHGDRKRVKGSRPHRHAQGIYSPSLSLNHSCAHCTIVTDSTNTSLQPLPIRAISQARPMAATSLWVNTRIPSTGLSVILIPSLVQQKQKQGQMCFSTGSAVSKEHSETKIKIVKALARAMGYYSESSTIIRASHDLYAACSNHAIQNKDFFYASMLS